MNPLQKVPVGRSGVSVTRLGLGGGGIASLFVDVPDDAAVGAVRRSLDLGINLFDTAPEYGHGKSEFRVGRALTGRNRDSFVLCTKIGKLLVPEDPGKVYSPEFINPLPFRLVYDYSYEGTMRSLEESLKRLGMSRTDVLYLHDPDDFYDEAIKGAYPALRKLRTEGVISAIGVGMNQAEMLARFARECEFDCFLLAGRYTLLDHVALKELLPLCVQKGISIVIGGPYNSGILATGAVPGAKFNYLDATPDIMEKVGDIEAICARYSTPLRAAALQFPLSHPAVAAIIPGAKSTAEMEENYRMIEFPIPAEFWAELRRNRLLPEDAPVPGETDYGICNLAPIDAKN
jgi:D-threo-aldose 1-dehydrogenase